MSTVRTGPVIGLLVQIVLLAVLAETVGLGAAGWVAGLAYGAVLCALLSRGMSRSGAGALSPADRVTLSRAILVGGVTALAADSFGRSAPVTLMVVLTSVALALDAVDGYTARRTGTTSELGARFDMEIDSFLVLVLCLHVAPSVGGWVLAIGAMRYVFVAASWVLGWMRGSLPPRYWRKVVAAVQGVVLTVAMGDALPGPLTTVVLVASLALLVESFGRDVAWLWTTRHLRHSLVLDTPGSQHAPGIHDASGAMAHASSPPSHSTPSAGVGLAGLGSGRPDGLPWSDRPTVAVARRGIARV
ncbi:CDP-alcohol phosphatidyltransferase family protein [Micromonospora sp. NPDC050784]|uniref:CDP-alcohol phosphatidyltransferase family protein n=1 Tax=Micromonospora sp. NPDC050784 TaxID=3364281 RepID=UPI00378B782D